MNNLNLILHLKKEYFEQIKQGVKLEEYRLFTEYWRKRLVSRTYGRIILLLGYPKSDDISRRMVKLWKGWKIKIIIHPHFGDNPVKVYAIDVS